MLRLLKVSVALLLAAVVAASASGATMNYQVRIENLIPGGADTGQPFSPPVVAVHTSGYAMFEPGAMAGAGLEQVAREGNPAVLQGELSSNPNIRSSYVGTGPFYGTQVLNVHGSPGDLLSMVWMLGRTNDLFSGLHDVALPAQDSLQFNTDVWDSGTEVNTGLVQDIPFYGNHNVGPDEHVPIAAITSYTITNDPVHGVLNWTFPPAGRVTIRVLGPVPTDEATWGEVKALYR